MIKITKLDYYNRETDKKIKTEYVDIDALTFDDANKIIKEKETSELRIDPIMLDIKGY